MFRLLVIVAIIGLVQWCYTHPDSEMTRSVMTQVEKAKGAVRANVDQAKMEAQRITQKLKR